MIHWAFEKCESLIERGCKAVASRIGTRLITTEGDPYLSRSYIFRRRWLLQEEDDNEGGIDPVTGTWRDYVPGIYLHYFHRGDLDRELHNHPWGFSFSLILTNGYIEERWTENGVIKRELRPGSINIIRGDDFHRVDLRDQSNGCWTLFFAGRRVQNWGFWNPNRPRETFVYHEDYVDERDREPNGRSARKA